MDADEWADMANLMMEGECSGLCDRSMSTPSDGERDSDICMNIADDL